MVSLGKRPIENWAEPTLTKAAGSGEGVRGAAEDGVGEAVGWPGVSLGGCPLTGELAEAYDEEEEEGETSGSGSCGGEGRE